MENLNCEFCFGSGQHICDTCDGKLVIPCPFCSPDDSEQCSYCEDGFVECFDCGGTGLQECKHCQ